MKGNRFWAVFVAVCAVVVALLAAGGGCAPAFAEIRTGKMIGPNTQGVLVEGTANYRFEEAPGLLTISGGEFTYSQWEYTTGQLIGVQSIKKVVFESTTMSDGSLSFNHQWWAVFCKPFLHKVAK